MDFFSICSFTCTSVISVFNLYSYECVGDSRLRCDLVDLYYTLFGTRKPLCFLDDAQQLEEASSRRKSALTTREGVDEFKRVSFKHFFIDIDRC